MVIVVFLIPMSWYLLGSDVGKLILSYVMKCETCNSLCPSETSYTIDRTNSTVVLSFCSATCVIEHPYAVHTVVGRNILRNRTRRIKGKTKQVARKRRGIVQPPPRPWYKLRLN